jgi:hypothetical protein
MIRPKSQNLNIRHHDGILSIGNFMLMKNDEKSICTFSAARIKQKKIAPYFRGNTHFAIFFFFLQVKPRLFIFQMWKVK